MCITTRPPKMMHCWSQVGAQERPGSEKDTEQWTPSYDCKQDWNIDAELDWCGHAILAGEPCHRCSFDSSRESVGDGDCGSINIEYEWCATCRRDNERKRVVITEDWSPFCSMAIPGRQCPFALSRHEAYNRILEILEELNTIEIQEDQDRAGQPAHSENV